MDLASETERAGERIFDHLRSFLRYLVRTNRNQPVPAERKERQCSSVVARKHFEITRPVAKNFHHLREISRRFLCCDDVLEFFSKLFRCAGGDVRRRSSRDVVEHYRK